MCKKVSPKMERQAKSLEESLYPLNLLNFVLGLGVLQVPYNRPWPKLSALYALSRSVGYGALLWYVGTYKPIKYSDIKIVPSVFRVILGVNIVITALSTVLSFINYRLVQRLVKRLAQADETLEVFGIDPDYASEYKECIKIIFFWCLIGVFVFATDITMNYFIFGEASEAIFITTIFDFPLLLNPIAELNFGVAVSFLGKRFERLNALIQSVIDCPLPSSNPNDLAKYENILKCNQNKVAVRPNYYNKNRNNLELMLKTVRQLHLDLCAISRKVNYTCSKQMSMQMAATFLILTGFSYSLYLVYNEPNISIQRKVPHYVSLSIWISISIFRMIHVVRTSVNVTTESQKTSQIAHEIQVPKSKSKLNDEIHQLSLQIMQHPLYFTASGLIVLDFGYVRGFVGSVTTYLMILIQNQPDMIKAANTLVEGAFDSNLANVTNTKLTT